MNKLFRTLLLVVLGFNACAMVASAQSSDAVPALSTDRTAPSYDMKGQALFDLENVQKKFVQLAEVIPADKLTWRPAPDARSYAEVFLHVASERYGILGLMGAEAPAG